MTFISFCRRVSIISWIDKRTKALILKELNTNVGLSLLPNIRGNKIIDMYKTCDKTQENRYHEIYHKMNCSRQTKKRNSHIIYYYYKQPD